MIKVPFLQLCIAATAWLATFAVYPGERNKPMEISICPRLVPAITGGDERAFVARVEDLFINKADQWQYVSKNMKKYPRLKVGLLEAGFKFHWMDKDKFPPERPNAKSNLGDLKNLVVDIMNSCKKKGTRLDMFQPEYSYARIENTQNGWEKLKAMETFCREEGLQFVFLFNDHEGGKDSDKLFHDNVMKCLRAVHANGLKPDMGTIQSWYKHPVDDLPDDRPHTFMYLAKEFIRETRKD